jgi:hypothetical protein
MGKPWIRHQIGRQETAKVNHQFQIAKIPQEFENRVINFGSVLSWTGTARLPRACNQPDNVILRLQFIHHDTH